MDAYRAMVWLHIVMGILLAGQALFWLVMLAALRQRFGAAGARAWLQETQAARWPHVAVPQALRLPLPYVDWATFAAACLTGALLMHLGREPGGGLWTAKLVLLSSLALLQLALAWRPLPAVIVGNFLLTLVLMVISGWMVRG